MLLALSNVSTTRSFCESDKLLALKILLTYNNFEFKRLTSFNSDVIVFKVDFVSLSSFLVLTSAL